jgi:iron complex transport system permease protein
LLQTLETKLTSQPLSREIPGYQRRRRTRLLAMIALAIAAVLIVLSVLMIGSVKISFADVWGILISHLPLVHFQGSWPATSDTIIWGIRLPRTLLAGLVGAALGVAGATYQGLFRNPLADPYLLGVAQGAAFGASLGFVFAWSVFGMYLIPILAFLGALAAVAVVYLIARVGRTLPNTTLILAGVVIGTLLISATSYLSLVAPDKTHSIVSWFMGGFSTSDWTQVGLVAPYIILGIVVICLFSRQLNVMQLDEEQAQQLGINVERTKIILLIVTTLITAAAVCFVGTIGFMGIIVPHAVRLIFGPDHRSLLPLSALVGAVLLILADTAARALIPPTEIPVGIITAFIGAPFFVFLLRRKKKAIF